MFGNGAHSGAGAADEESGTDFAAYLDAPWEGLSGLVNELGRVDSVRWGAIDGQIAATSGKILLDGLSSWR